MTIPEDQPTRKGKKGVRRGPSLESILCKNPNCHRKFQPLNHKQRYCSFPECREIQNEESKERRRQWWRDYRAGITRDRKRAKGYISKKIDRSCDGGNSPEKALWAAVMLRAYEDISGDLMKRAPQKEPARTQFLNQKERIIEDAKRWFNSDEIDIGSYTYVCDILDLDSLAILAAVGKAYRPTDGDYLYV